jgi:hypothetical protein
MPISDTQKVDFLWKKTIFGVTNTGGAGKQGFEETIGSPAPVYSNSIFAETIPVPAPFATDTIVRYYGPSQAIRMTADITVAGNAAWIATETFNDLGTKLGNWIAPSVDAGYLVDVYRNDPTVPANKLNGGVNNQEWVFDYTAGVLRFVNNVPAGITSLWLVGHRYIGATGLGGAGVNLRDTAVEYTGNSISSGTYSFLNFFEFAPQTGTITVEVNGQRIQTNQYSVDGRNLVLDIDALPYDLDTGDIVSARYAFAR